MKKLVLGLVLSVVAFPAFAAEVVLRDTPCRLFDSRNIGGLGLGSKVTSLLGATIETADPGLDVVSYTTSGGIAINYQGGEAECRVPANATGMIVNLVAIQPDSGGWARIWAYGETEPLSTSINVTAGQLNEVTGIMVNLGTDGKVSLSALISSSHYVLDLAGFTLETYPDWAIATGTVEEIGIAEPSEPGGPYYNYLLDNGLSVWCAEPEAILSQCEDVVVGDVITATGVARNLYGPVLYVHGTMKINP